MKPKNNKLTLRLRTVRKAWIQSIVWWNAAWLCGCVHPSPQVLVIPSDRAIRFLPADNPLTNHPDLYLVPPARMQEILRALSTPGPPAFQPAKLP
jgi:hypothetical protein